MAMVLQVLHLNGEAIGEFLVEPTDRIKELQEVVELKVLNTCTLFFDGVKLHPQDAVDDCGLQDGSLLTAIIAANSAQLTEVALGELWLRNKGKKGFTVRELKDTGCSASQLKAFFILHELKDAGFTASELYRAFKLCELKDAGFTLAELKVVKRHCPFCNGTGRLAFNMWCAFCSPSGSGCAKGLITASDLKDVGYGLSELQDAGYGLSEPQDTGYGLSELKVYQYERNKVTLASLLLN